MARRIAGVALLCIVGAPIPHQVFGQPIPLLQSWRMFHGTGDDLCQVRFEQVEGGQRRALSQAQRLELLGRIEGRSARMSDRRIARAEGAWALGGLLCDTLGPGADLRLTMRCGDGERGWTEPDDGTVNLCAPGHPATDRHRPESP